ncbi:MAG: DNA polymerase III subunit epsilon [Gammaproteobacteria bacterium]|nr:DNA polymerase III subunit epsilon [Gammaproteobacteria bacterium]
MRQIVLDTETTGLEIVQGHRVIELGCVELVNRRLSGGHFHYYLNPDRDIDAGALEVHGITAEFLLDKPRFEDIAAEFLEFISDAELIIHNAEFDVGFLTRELQLADAGYGPLEDYCEKVLDTLAMARKLHPGQRNSLDALCKRYQIDNAHRELHGALLDAEILADVYLAMTGGQTNLLLEAALPPRDIERAARSERVPLPVILPDAEELALHEEWLRYIDEQAQGGCVWLQADGIDEVA